MDFTSPAQLVGYVAFVLGVAAFAQRIDWRLKLLVATECAVYTLHFYLLGNNAASLSAGLSTLRMFASLKTRSPWVAAFFLVSNIGLGAALATSAMSWFSIAAGVCGTVAVFFLTGIGMRAVLFLATLCWLANNILSGSIGGTLLESIIAVVNGATMLRLWRGRRSRPKAKTRGKRF